MAKTAKSLVEQAKAWLGFNEADGTHKKIIDIYNAHKPLARGYSVKYTDAWCATFVSAVAIKTGYTDIIPTECGCGEMVKLFQKLGSWVENENRTPNPGDIIFYDWQDDGVGDNTGWPDHVGIVEKVENGKITIIEGNYSNSVKRRTISVNGKNIRGYGVPKYEAEKQVEYKVTASGVMKDKTKVDSLVAQLKAEGFAVTVDEVTPAPQPTPAPAQKSVDEIAKEVLAGKWGNGSDRKERLTAAGYDYKAIQKRVNELLS